MVQPAATAGSCVASPDAIVENIIGGRQPPDGEGKRRAHNEGAPVDAQSAHEVTRRIRIVRVIGVYVGHRPI